MRVEQILSESWYQTYKVPLGVVDVFLNPSKSELYRLIAKVQRAYPNDHFTKMYPLRASVAPNGDLFVWDASIATHQDVIYNHNLPSVGGFIYLNRECVMYNDLHLQHDDRDDPQNVYEPEVRDKILAIRDNRCLNKFYGSDFKIVGLDYGDINPGEYVIDDDFLERFVSAS